jgi:hypothetical protein
MSVVLPSSISSPLTRVHSRSPDRGSPTSSTVTMGEREPLQSAFFPNVHSRECIWCTRADRSLNAA